MKNTLTIQDVMSTYPRLSLKRICDTLEIGYQYILKTSKQPIAGQPYDPNAVNYAAIQAIFDRRNIDLSNVAWNIVEASVVTYEPVTKLEEFEVGNEIKLRADDDVYVIHMITDTHIVFMAVDSTQPRVMNKDTFMHQSPRIINK